MKITINICALLTTLIVISASSRLQVTDFYKQFIPKLSYRAFVGYIDIDWYPASQQTIYYSLWESSSRKLADHSTPVIIYLAGGPGLSSHFSSFRQFGPIQVTKSNGQFKLTQNPWSWNYYAHLVFVDQPAGVGFSYSKGKPLSDSKTAGMHFVNFLSNLLKDNIYAFSNNPIYLAGQGYAGHYIAAAIQYMNNNPKVNIPIQGVILGGPYINPEKQINYYQSFISAAGVISPKTRNDTHWWTNQAILKIRNSKFSEVRSSVNNIWDYNYNGMSIHNYRRYTTDNEGIQYAQFLEKYKQSLGVDNVNFVQFSQVINTGFSEDMFKSYATGLDSILKSGKRTLIYTGQNDVITNSAGVLTCLQDAEWPGARDWRQARKQIWKQSGIISGWIKKYKHLIYVIVKNTGHYIFQDQTSSHKSIYLMLNNYFTKKW